MEGTNRRRVLVMAIAVVAVVVVAGATALAVKLQDSGAGSLQAQDSGFGSLQTEGCPGGVGSAFEVYTFDDLGEMTAASDLVVRAHVESAEPGRVYGNADEGGQFQVRQANLVVDDVLASKGPTPERIALEEEGWDADGTCYFMNGLTWSEVGNEYYYFLRKNPDSDTYIHASSQGRALIKGDTLEAPTADTTLEEVIEQLTPTQLEDQVKQAEVDVRDGRLDPLPEPGADPPAEEPHR